jgi:hypothetical protein
MSKRCELQKEYYQANGNYKGNGNYDDKYVTWLENHILSLHFAMNEIENAMERWHLARDNDNETLEEINKILVSTGRLEWFNRNKC